MHVGVFGEYDLGKTQAVREGPCQIPDNQLCISNLMSFFASKAPCPSGYRDGVESRPKQKDFAGSCYAARGEAAA